MFHQILLSCAVCVIPAELMPVQHLPSDVTIVQVTYEDTFGRQFVVTKGVDAIQVIRPAGPTILVPELCDDGSVQLTPKPCFTCGKPLDGKLKHEGCKIRPPCQCEECKDCS